MKHAKRFILAGLFVILGTLTLLTSCKFGGGGGGGDDGTPPEPVLNYGQQLLADYPDFEALAIELGLEPTTDVGAPPIDGSYNATMQVTGSIDQDFVAKDFQQIWRFLNQQVESIDWILEDLEHWEGCFLGGSGEKITILTEVSISSKDKDCTLHFLVMFDGDIQEDGLIIFKMLLYFLEWEGTECSFDEDILGDWNLFEGALDPISGTPPIETYFLDADTDGYGDPNTPMDATSPPSGYVTNNYDCDDDDINVNPDAEEICDFVDNNCNGDVDEGLSANCEETIVLHATQDTYASWAPGNENLNYGVQSTLYSTSDIAGSYVSYIQFQLPDLTGKEILSADLQLTGTFIADDPSGTSGLNKVTESWDELLLTYTNRPGFNTPTIVQTVPKYSDTEIHFDVKQFVESWTSGTPNNGIRVATSLSTGLLAVFYSKEAGIHPPTLTITYKQ
jgi:hypothetical protein